MSDLEESILDAFEEFAEQHPEVGKFDHFETDEVESVIITVDGRRWYARQLGGDDSYGEGWRFYDQWV